MNTKELIAQNTKLIELEAHRYSSFVPYSVVLAEAYKLANEAAKKYDVSLGVKFSTFLTNYLKKLSRISTTYGGSVRIPENKQFKIQKVNEAEQDLRGELGRDPTMSELAQATGFSIQQVNNLLTVRKKDINLNNMVHSPVFIEDNNDEWVHFVYHDLPEKDKYIFENKTGFGGKKVKSNEEIAKDLNISTSTVNNRLNIITSKLAEGWK